MAESPEAPIDRTTDAAAIPAYIEEKHIAEAVRRTRERLDYVLVIDDGSTDVTAAAARNA